MNQRIIRILIALGATLVVLTAAPYPMFDLSRFFAPKELVMNAVALLLALAALREAKKLELNRIDLALAAYLSLCFISASLAQNHWLSIAALAITLSGATVFWVARSTAKAGARDAIIAVAASAAVLGALVSLAQAYGFNCALFSPHRIPGGTLGNRNFMAHLAVICLPVLILSAIKSRRLFLAGAAGVFIIVQALVLSRTRAAWLGFAAGAIVLGCGFWRARGELDSKTSSRLKALLAAGLVGALAALALPNKLEWTSDSPYMDTVSGLANYHSGSGHGRLIQYERTLRIVAAHPLLGAGPGNWEIVYPKFVKGFDRSIDYGTGITFNPWPSSDWMAILSERGIPAFAALLLALFWLLLSGWRRVAMAANEDEYLQGLMLAATIIITATVGCFDAVILLPATAFMTWAILGALAPDMPVLQSLDISPRMRGKLILAATFAGIVAILRSAGQVAAMAQYSKAHTITQYALASRLDPGNFHIRMHLESLKRRGITRANPIPMPSAPPERASDETAEPAPGTTPPLPGTGFEASTDSTSSDVTNTSTASAQASTAAK